MEHLRNDSSRGVINGLPSPPPLPLPCLDPLNVAHTFLCGTFSYTTRAVDSGDSGAPRSSWEQLGAARSTGQTDLLPQLWWEL